MAGAATLLLLHHGSARVAMGIYLAAHLASSALVMIMLHLPLVGEPWTSFKYATFANDTSRQQALWFATGRPKADSYWPEAQVVYCTGESYVPKGKARLVVTLHDAAYFEAGAHQQDRSLQLQRLKWKMLFHRLSHRADKFPYGVAVFGRSASTLFFGYGVQDVRGA